MTAFKSSKPLTPAASTEGFRLDSLFAESSTAVALVTNTTELLYANPAFLKLFRLYGRNAERPDFLKALLASPRTGGPSEQQIVKSNGSVCWVKVEVSQVALHFSGQPSELLMIHDITEQKHIEAVCQESISHFRQLTDNLQEIFWLSDPESGEVLFVSPAYERI